MWILWKKSGCSQIGCEASIYVGGGGSVRALRRFLTRNYMALGAVCSLQEWSRLLSRWSPTVDWASCGNHETSCDEVPSILGDAEGDGRAGLLHVTASGEINVNSHHQWVIGPPHQLPQLRVVGGEYDGGGKCI